MTQFDGLVRLGDQFWLEDASAGSQSYAFRSIADGAEASPTGRGIVVHTYRAAGWAPLTLRSVEAPPSELPENALVTDVSLTTDGALAVRGIDGDWGALAAAGSVRARVIQHGADLPMYGGDVGGDAYEIIVWSAPPSETVARSRIDANESGARGVRPSSHSIASLAALPLHVAIVDLGRHLACGDESAVRNELTRHAASSDPAVRAHVAGVLWLAPSHESLARLRDDPDERVREVASSASRR